MGLLMYIIPSLAQIVSPAHSLPTSLADQRATQDHSLLINLTAAFPYRNFVTRAVSTSSYCLEYLDILLT